MLVVLAIIAALILAANVIGLWAMLHIEREMSGRIKQFEDHAADLENEVRDFITSPGKDDQGADIPSPLASAMFAISQMIGSQIATSAAAIINQKRGQISKAMAEAGEAVAGDMMAEDNPLLALAAGAFPSLGKTMQKKPWVAAALQKLNLSGLAKGPGAGSNGNNHNGKHPSVF